MATSSNIAGRPDHVIIWLDKNMGVRGNNESSKKILDNDANLDHPPENEDQSEIDRLICRINRGMNQETFEDLIKSPLRMFVDETECIKCINDSIEAKKKVFLIASGQKGALIVPKIYKQLSGFIYIFCGQRDVHEEWTRLYVKDLEVYDDEKGVFGKVLSDIAIYYYSKSQETSSDRTSSIKYLEWAQRLFKSATKLDRVNRKDYLEYVRDGLAEQNVSVSDRNDNNDPMGQDPDDD